MIHVVTPRESWKAAWVCYFACPRCRNTVAACAWEPEKGTDVTCPACGGKLRVRAGGLTKPGQEIAWQEEDEIDDYGCEDNRRGDEREDGRAPEGVAGEKRV